MPLSRYQKYFVTVIPAAFVLLVCYFFSSIVAYIILAWILTLVGAPIYNRLNQVIGNTLASIFTLALFAMLFMGLIWLFVPPVVQQARNFAKLDYSRIAHNLEEPIDDWKLWLERKGIIQGEDQEKLALPIEQNPFEDLEIVQVDSLLRSHGDSSITGVTLLINIHNPGKNEYGNLSEEYADRGFFDQFRSRLIELLNPSRITEVFGSMISLIGNVMVTIMSTFFIAFFFLKEQGLFTRIIKSLVPNESEERWAHALDESARLLMRYFIGILLQISVITVFVSLVLGLLGFKNALLIGFFAALMNVIPYIGPVLGASFGIIITVASDYQMPFYSDLLPHLGVLVLVFAIMQLVDNFVLQPNIFSKSVKAHPLEIFIVVMVGAQLHGILGMVLAIPIYTVIRVIAKVFLSEFKLVKRITQSL